MNLEAIGTGPLVCWHWKDKRCSTTFTLTPVEMKKQILITLSQKVPQDLYFHSFQFEDTKSELFVASSQVPSTFSNPGIYPNRQSSPPRSTFVKVEFQGDGTPRIMSFPTDSIMVEWSVIPRLRISFSNHHAMSSSQTVPSLSKFRASFIVKGCKKGPPLHSFRASNPSFNVKSTRGLELA